MRYNNFIGDGSVWASVVMMMAVCWGMGISVTEFIA